ncbi:MAG: RNA-binding protein [Deltaproteobacteria bacterium]|nr:RNA-binding protein [Deltaproteobacteria bacterium]
MANKQLFSSAVGKLSLATDALNHEGAPAYKLGPQEALAQYAMTGCLNSTFYASGHDQLQAVIEQAKQVSPKFIAQLAVYSREKGYMKDLPALFCALLSVKDSQLLEKVFFQVVDNAKMLRNFVQIMRSGAVGRKSLGSLPKKLIIKWLAERTEEALFSDIIGDTPSLADIVKMVHPKPANSKREAFYGYLLGKSFRAELLPPIVGDFETYKKKPTGALPAVPFQLLTSLELGPRQWKDIARRASWQMTRMNLNTFARHGVFADKKLAQLVAKRLRDQGKIKQARAFPYQLLVTFRALGSDMPRPICEALQDAMEIAVSNVPAFSGQVVVCPDVSGSMSSPLTGYRRGATTAVRAIDVAALMAAAVMRKNPSAIVLPFEETVVPFKLNSRDSVMTNADKLATIGGGGTNCSAPLAWLNAKNIRADFVILVSDNQSWIDARREGATQTMREWQKFKLCNPQAKLACIDIQPYATAQCYNGNDIFNVGGFSDQVFEVLERFVANTLSPGHFVGLIENVEI